MPGLFCFLLMLTVAAFAPVAGPRLLFSVRGPRTARDTGRRRV